MVFDIQNSSVRTPKEIEFSRRDITTKITNANGIKIESTVTLMICFRELGLVTFAVM